MDRSSHVPLLDESQLKHMSRNIRDSIPDKTGPDVLKGIHDSFQSVCDAAAAPGESVTYRVAAWNTLSAVLERCSQHRDADIRSAIYSEWWTRTFGLYLAQAQLVRPKSARQFLATLVTVLHRARSDPTTDRAKSHACRSMVEPLMHGHDHGRAKTCASALAHFVSMHILSVDDVMRQYLTARSGSGILAQGGDQASIEGFLCNLFRWMGKADFGSTIGQLVSVLLDSTHGSALMQHTTKNNGIDCPLWSGALQQTTRDNSIDVSTLRVHLLPTLFKRSSSDYYYFLESLGLRTLLDPPKHPPANVNRVQLQLLCASLQAGKSLGMLCETEDRNIVYEDGTVDVPVRGLAHLLHHSCPTARLTALSLLITSRTATRPLLPSALKAIKRNLSHFFADTDANFRSEVCGLVQRLIDRVRAITAVAARQTNSGGDDLRASDNVQPAEVLRSHRDFLIWLSRFFLWELRPTASYQRHIFALKCNLIAARSGLDDAVTRGSLSKSALGETRWPFRLRIVSQELCGLLLDRVVDPFDDVRQTAAAILALYPTDNGECLRQTELALSRAEQTMLVSGRADHADGVAHLSTLLHRHRDGGCNTLLRLIERLEQMINTARADLSEAVAKYPLHGLLTSLRYILEQDHRPLYDGDQFLSRLVCALADIWSVVKPILCDDAPEGYMPEDAEETENVSTKDTLSYCWRALKESSMLLSTLLQYLNLDDTVHSHQLSELCFVQLAELRHRGAFSTVAQTWIACCLASRDVPTADGQSILHQWYAKVVSILRNKTTINTRRSAGLPSLLCGILIAERDGQLLKQAFVDLEAIAREEVAPDTAQEGSLPQVHAMNCLKDVLKNSRLGEASEQYVPIALRLAADALQSHAWAVRNCGLMLFRAVIDRLLGTSDAHTESDVHSQRRLSADQHPQILEVVLGLLNTTLETTGLTSARSEGVFPALQLLQRLQVPGDRTVAVRRAVRALMGSPWWLVRDKAAYTYASLVEEGEAIEVLEGLLRTTIANQNALHGALLCARQINKRLAVGHGRSSQADRLHSPVPDEGQVRTVDEVGRADKMYTLNKCAVTQAAYIDLLRDSTKTSHRSSSGDVTQPIKPAVTDLHWTLMELPDYLGAAGSAAALRLALARLLACQLLLAVDLSSDLRQDVRALLEDLAKHDANACSAFFLEATTVLKYGSQVTQEGLRTVLESCSDIEQRPDASLHLKCQVVELLLHITDHMRAEIAVSPPIMTLNEAMSQGTSQRFMDLHLQWRATCLERVAGSEEITSVNFLGSVHDWADCCVTAVKHEAVHSRDAAALAMTRLSSLWTVLSSNDTMSRDMLNLCMSVYDLLNDDDEDIRILASTAASRILAVEKGRGYPSGVVPAVAGQRLMAFMVRRSPTDPGFIREAVHRAFGGDHHDQSGVASQLQKLAVENTALFVEEKQNLYVDEAREVKAWSQVMMSLPYQAVSKQTVRRLSRYISQGLDALTAHSSAEGGSLSWSSRPEPFTLGLRIIYGAQYLLRLSQVGVSLSVRPSTLRHQLATLAFGPGALKCHSLWRREAERVLVESTMGKLVAVHAVLRNITTQ